MVNKDFYKYYKNQHFIFKYYGCLNYCKKDAKPLQVKLVHYMYLKVFQTTKAKLWGDETKLSEPELSMSATAISVHQSKYSLICRARH